MFTDWRVSRLRVLRLFMRDDRLMLDGGFLDTGFLDRFWCFVMPLIHKS